MTETVFQKGSITIYKRFALGKMRLSGHNKENGVTVTSVLNNENELTNKINSMINELQKNVQINLTSRLERIERNILNNL